MIYYFFSISEGYDDSNTIKNKLDNVFDFRNIQVVSGGNVNNYRTGGIYYFGDTGTNLPAIFSIVIVISTSEQDVVQICVSLQTRLMYFRTSVNGTWNSWRSFDLSNV